MRKIKTAMMLTAAIAMITGCSNSSTVSTVSPASTLTTQQVGSSSFSISTQLPEIGNNGTVSMTNDAGKSVSFSLGMTKAQVEELLKNADISYLDGEKDLEVTDVDMIFTKDLYFQFRDTLEIIYVNSQNVKTALGLKNGDSKDKIEQMYGTADIVKLCSYTCDDATKEYTYYEYKGNSSYFWILADNEAQTVRTWGISSFTYPGDEYHVFKLWSSGYSDMIQ